MAEKKPFEWKTSEVLGEVSINDKKKVEVSFNSLDIESGDSAEERWYVSMTTQQFYKKRGAEGMTWNITKNTTFPVDAFSKIVELVEENLDKLD